MMYASDFREKARNALSGNWGKAVAVGLVATLLSGGLVATNTGASSGGGASFSFANHNALIALGTVAVVTGLLAIVLGGAVSLGWCHFHTNLVKDTEDAKFSDLFAHFDRLGRGFVMNIVVSFFTILWCTLFLIPGMVVVYVAVQGTEEMAMIAMFFVLLISIFLGLLISYRYAMVPYLMAEFPELKTMDAIRESKRLMKGKKWRLFCLQMSFFGWALLCLFTLGIGNLWLTPYMQTAQAAFYMYITGRLDKEEPKENSVEW